MDEFAIYLVSVKDEMFDKLREMSPVVSEALDTLFGDNLIGYIKPCSFTCDDCRLRGICVYAFDLYNTDGDCLAAK